MAASGGAPIVRQAAVRAAGGPFLTTPRAENGNWRRAAGSPAKPSARRRSTRRRSAARSRSMKSIRTSPPSPRKPDFPRDGSGGLQIGRQRALASRPPSTSMTMPARVSSMAMLPPPRSGTIGCSARSIASSRPKARQPGSSSISMRASGGRGPPGNSRAAAGPPSLCRRRRGRSRRKAASGSGSRHKQRRGLHPAPHRCAASGTAAAPARGRVRPSPAAHPPPRAPPRLPRAGGGGAQRLAAACASRRRAAAAMRKYPASAAYRTRYRPARRGAAPSGRDPCRRLQPGPPAPAARRLHGAVCRRPAVRSRLRPDRQRRPAPAPPEARRPPPKGAHPVGRPFEPYFRRAAVRQQRRRPAPGRFGQQGPVHGAG